MTIGIVKNKDENEDFLLFDNKQEYGLKEFTFLFFYNRKLDVT